jgi:hypothetical protein
LLDRHAEHVDHQLRQRGRDALPHLVDGGEHLDHAVGLDLHGDALFQHVAAGPFEEGGDAQAAQLAGALLCAARFSKPLQSARSSPRP